MSDELDIKIELSKQLDSQIEKKKVILSNLEASIHQSTVKQEMDVVIRSPQRRVQRHQPDAGEMPAAFQGFG